MSTKAVAGAVSGNQGWTPNEDINNTDAKMAEVYAQLAEEYRKSTVLQSYVEKADARFATASSNPERLITVVIDFVLNQAIAVGFFQNHPQVQEAVFPTSRLEQIAQETAAIYDQDLITSFEVFAQDLGADTQFLNSAQDPTSKAKAIRAWMAENKELCAQVTTLAVSGKELHSIPCEFELFVNLEHLDLSHNHITKISPKILYLKALKMLNLNHNQITTIHAKINCLSELEELHLAHNQIKTVPSQLAELKALTHLDVRHNPIESVLEIADLKIQTIKW